VPRIEEILRLTKNPKNPSLTVALKSSDAQIQERAMKYANMIEYTRLHDIVKSVQIYFDPYDDNTNIKEDVHMMQQYLAYEELVKTMTQRDYTEEQTKSKWVLRIEMNADIMLDKNIHMDDVYFAINQNYGAKISCIYSDYNDKNLIFRIRMVWNQKKEGKKEPNTQLDNSDQIYLLKNFQETLLKKTILRGVDGISKVLPRKVPNSVVKDDGKFIRKDTWVLDTVGTNLLEVLGLSFIDSMHTYSNDIYEVYLTLGIEAARQCILTEFVDVMEHSDVYLNYHHLSVLCDRMTYNGKDMVAVYRSGILKDDVGPVAKSTFEMHTEMFLNAARHGHLDNMRGVSANIMCGQFGYFGTGAFNVILDLEQMERNNDSAESVSFRDDSRMENEEVIKSGTFCNKDNIVVDNQINDKAPLHTICDDDDYDMGF
jgi:DNA-directed RNA polymerase II subunit RPB1